MLRLMISEKTKRMYPEGLNQQGGMALHPPQTAKSTASERFTEIL